MLAFVVTIVVVKNSLKENPGEKRNESGNVHRLHLF